MELVLARGKQIQDDCAPVIKKLRANRSVLDYSFFLIRTSYSLNSDQQQFPNQEKPEDPSLFHYALYSGNILAATLV
ncbi:hypothetical protein MKW92_013608, partial [Papaver armeniacum]